MSIWCLGRELQNISRRLKCQNNQNNLIHSCSCQQFNIHQFPTLSPIEMSITGVDNFNFVALVSLSYKWRVFFFFIWDFTLCRHSDNDKIMNPRSRVCCENIHDVDYPHTQITVYLWSILSTLQSFLRFSDMETICYWLNEQFSSTNLVSRNVWCSSLYTCTTLNDWIIGLHHHDELWWSFGVIGGWMNARST